MARLEAGEHGAGSSGERQWLDMAAEARGGADWMCESCGTLGAGGPEAAGWQLCCPRCDAIDSLAWRPTAPRHTTALGGIVLDQLPAAEALPAAAASAVAPLHPAMAASSAGPAMPGSTAAGSMPPAPMAAGPTRAGPIPHGSLSPAEPAPVPPEGKPEKPAPLGASVDAARLVN
jgi:hypothetical protein